MSNLPHPFVNKTAAPCHICGALPGKKHVLSTEAPVQSVTRSPAAAGDPEPSAASRPTAPKSRERVKDSTGGFTPGPWRMGQAQGSHGNNFPVIQPELAKFEPHHDYHIGVAYKREDAALFSAAPDLLAAVEELLLCPNKHRPDEVWQAARDAVRKARGGN